MSTPGHHNDVVLVGDIREVYTDGNGAVIGVILMVNADEPCEVPVMFPEVRTGLSVGDRLWARGRLAFEPMPNRRELLLFVQARWIVPVRRPQGPSGVGRPTEEGESSINVSKPPFDEVQVRQDTST